MIDVYHHGPDIGISIHGIGGFCLLFYFIIEMMLLFLTKSLFIHKLLIYFRLHKELKKIIPDWWTVDKINTLLMQGKSNGFAVYLKISHKVDNDNIIRSYVYVDWLGRIKHYDFDKDIKRIDQKKELQIKEWKRNKSLEELGI